VNVDIDKDDLGARLFMITATLALLIDKARGADPNFDEFARRQFDILLGMILQTKGAPGTIELQAREHFLGLLRTSWGDMVTDPSFRRPSQSINHLTLRRRFFNWLERG
jgi:hypothetical protein